MRPYGGRWADIPSDGDDGCGGWVDMIARSCAPDFGMGDRVGVGDGGGAVGRRPGPCECGQLPLIRGVWGNNRSRIPRRKKRGRRGGNHLVSGGVLRRRKAHNNRQVRRSEECLRLESHREVT